MYVVLLTQTMHVVLLAWHQAVRQSGSSLGLAQASLGMALTLLRSFSSCTLSSLTCQILK